MVFVVQLSGTDQHGTDAREHLITLLLRVNAVHDLKNLRIKLAE